MDELKNFWEFCSEVSFLDPVKFLKAYYMPHMICRIWYVAYDMPLICQHICRIYSIKWWFRVHCDSDSKSDWIQTATSSSFWIKSIIKHVITIFDKKKLYRRYSIAHVYTKSSATTRISKISDSLKKCIFRLRFLIPELHLKTFI